MEPKNPAKPDITPPANDPPAAGHLPKEAAPATAEAKTDGAKKPRRPLRCRQEAAARKATLPLG